MSTYDIYTVIVLGTHSGKANGFTVEPPTKRWFDYNGHGCFRDDAEAEAQELKNSGLTVAIRIDTYKRSRNASTPPIRSTTKQL